MASNPLLTVVFAPAAMTALTRIFDHNAERYGIDRASGYELFLLDRIRDLARDPQSGKTVDTDPSFRYVVIRRRSRGDGHVAAYRIDPVAWRVEIVAIYHTKQDWRTRLESEPP